MQTAFTIEMLDQGFLGFRQFKPSYAHTEDDVRRYAKAIDAVFAKLAATDHSLLLHTPVAHSGFHRLTKE
jgi:hypothetical protein